MLQEWTTKPLGSITQTASGGTPDKKHPEYYNGDILWVRSGELDKGTIVDTEIKISQKGIDNSSAKVFPEGTLLIALYGATIGKLAFLGRDAATNQAVCGIFRSDEVILNYIYYYLLFQRSNLIKQGIGGAQPNISQSILKKLCIPYPISVKEQERIVSRIEELFSELDAGVETLQTIKKQLAVYRQAALKTVFDRYQEYVPLGTISNSRLGKMLDKEKNIGIPRAYLRNVNVRWFAFDLSDMLEMRITDEEVDKYSIQKDDLVICEGGEPGRCAVWQEKGSVFYQKALHRVRFTNGSNPRFYMYYLWFAAQTGRLTPYYTGTGIKHLTGESLVKVSVPNTDRIAQDSVVAEIETQLSMCEDIERTIDKGLQQSAAMRQSILKQAFEGGL